MAAFEIACVALFALIAMCVAISIAESWLEFVWRELGRDRHVLDGSFDMYTTKSRGPARAA